MFFPKRPYNTYRHTRMKVGVYGSFKYLCQASPFSYLHFSPTCLIAYCHLHPTAKDRSPIPNVTPSLGGTSPSRESVGTLGTSLTQMPSRGRGLRS